MTPEAQRIAIDGACGWKEIGECTCKRVPRGTFLQDGVHQSGHRPDFLNDLNAMNEAEKVLTPEQHEAWAGHMLAICTKPTLTEALFVGYWSRGFKIMSSTASQRAEAFLRTLNLWTD